MNRLVSASRKSSADEAVGHRWRALLDVWRADRAGPAVALVALMFLVVEAFPNAMPAGVYLTGVVYGVWSALVALSLVLVFRSSRLINFAAFQVGGTAGVLFSEVLRHHVIARLLSLRLHGSFVPGWSVTAEYWGAAVLAVGIAGLLSAGTYLALVRFFRGAPPLVGTVATIGVYSLLAALTTIIVGDVFGDSDLAGSTLPPQNVTIHLGGSVFGLPQLLTLALGVAVLPLVELFLRRSRLGTAVRAAAANPDRAASLGVDQARVTGAVWLLAGLLSGLSAVLYVASVGPGNLGGPVALVQVLTALVLAATVSLRIAFAAAIGIGVLQQGLLWSFSNGDLLDAALLALVLLVLLARWRRNTARVDPADSSWRVAREVRPVPPELRGHPEVRRMRIWLIASVAVVVGVYPFAVPVGQVELATQMIVYAMVGLSLLVVAGWAGLISLGQFAFAAVGGFVTSVLSGTLGLSPLVSLPLAALAGGVTAFLLGLPALRIRGLYLAVVSLAFSVACTVLLLGRGEAGRILPTSLTRPRLFGLGTDNETTFYFLCLIVLLAVLGGLAGLRRSRTGRALIASRDNERAAELFGVNLVRARLSAFAVSGVIAALAGGLFAFQQRSVDVGNYGPEVGFTILLMLIVGGMGSLAGPILGAAFLGLLMAFHTAAVGTVGLPIAVFAVLLAVPGGWTQAVFAGRDALLRRIALRNRIFVPSLIDRDHQVWLPGTPIPLAPKAGPGGAPAFVARRYTLDHEPLSVPRVAATGRGA